MKVKTLFAGLGVLALAGCGVAEVDAVRTLNPQGGDFSKALAREYKELTLFEADEMYDYISASRYADRGLAADTGNPVQPFELANFNLPASKVDELTRARADLVSVLDASARTKVPAAAADAQGKFDCWVEQQEENHQPDHIAACRDAFLAAMQIIEDEMNPPAPAPVAPSAPRDFTVLFDFDKANLNPMAQDVVINAIAAAKQYQSPVLLIGHADTSGPAAYNMALSRKRAETVARAFEKSGVPDVRIIVRAVGEEDLAVATGDGVRNPANRRVTIQIEQ